MAFGDITWKLAERNFVISAEQCPGSNSTLVGTVCDGIHNEEKQNTGRNSNSRGDSM